MIRVFAAVLASAALIACGFVHGVWTERFHPAPGMEQNVERLGQLNLDLGEWHGEELPVRPGQSGLGVAGCLERRYTHRGTGKVVKIALVCGRSGPVSIHTPNVCYAANGFRVGRPRRVDVPGGEFWTADAVRKSATDETRARIYWAWNNGHGWKAAGDARQEFVGSAVLYKLYVLRELDGPGEPHKPGEEACEEFMRLLLPELDRAVLPDGGA
jgi:hypothetical protein